MIYLVIIIFFITLFLNLRIIKKIYHPNIVFCFVWIIQLIGLSFFQNSFFEIQSSVFVILLIGFLFFNIGGIGASYLFYNRGGGSLNRSFSVNSYKFYLLASISILFLYKQYSIFLGYSSGDLSQQLIMVRTALSVDSEDVYGIYKYGTPISIIIFLLLWSEILLKKKTLLIMALTFIFFLVNLAYGFLSTGRGSVLMVFFMALSVYGLFELKSGRVTRLLIGVVLFFIVLSFVTVWMGDLLGKASDKSSENFMIMINQQFSSIPAFSNYIKNNEFGYSPAVFGENSLRFFYALLKSVGFNVEVKSTVQESVNIPNSTNLYTWFHLYFRDFGIFGVAFFPFFIGLLSAFIFNLVKKLDSPLSLVVVAFIYYPIFNSPAVEGVLTAISRWIVISLVLFLLTSKVPLKITGNVSRD